jgi:hypothetical protein
MVIRDAPFLCKSQVDGSGHLVGCSKTIQKTLLVRRSGTIVKASRRTISIVRLPFLRQHDCLLLDSCNAISPQHGEARQIRERHSPRAAVRLL